MLNYDLLLRVFRSPEISFNVHGNQKHNMGNSQHKPQAVLYRKRVLQNQNEQQGTHFE